jgi:hypothetical protein
LKLLLFGLAVAALPLWGGHPGTLPPIALYTHFEDQATDVVTDAMEHEVESIMAPMGLTFRWQDLATSDSRQASVELAVIEFKGRCDVNGLMAHDSNPGPLGWTNISDGVILPFATVDCSAVRSFIQRELLNIPGREKAFGRALGRVLAHELYHIIANTRHHGAEGVGREFYSAHDLLADNFQFEVRESLALMNGKAYAALANSSADGDEAEHRN